jgi:hypothetical protein
MQHGGQWSYHPDDCLCGVYGDGYCNRDGHCWSCCGAGAEDSDCTAPQMHPTHWAHPLHSQTIAGWRNHWPVYRSRDDLRALCDKLGQADS